MYINNIEVKGYKNVDTQLTLTLATNNLDEALKCVSEDIELRDGVGVLGIKFHGYTRVSSAVLENDVTKLTLERTQPYDQELHTLSAQLQAAIETNAMLEECIVEIANVVYA